MLLPLSVLYQNRSPVHRVFHYSSQRTSLSRLLGLSDQKHHRHRSISYTDTGSEHQEKKPEVLFEHHPECLLDVDRFQSLHFRPLNYLSLSRRMTLKKNSKRDDLLAELWHCILLLALFLGAVPPLLIFRC